MIEETKLDDSDHFVDKAKIYAEHHEKELKRI